MGCVYKITNNINQKVYIGYTTRSLEARFQQHIQSAYTRQKDGSYDNYLKRAIREYGFENFVIEELEQSDDKHFLQEQEKYWIKYYNSYAKWPNSNGYNLTIGGQGGNGQYVPIYVIDPVSLEIVDNYPSISEAYTKYGETIANILYHPDRPLTAKGMTCIKIEDYNKLSKDELKDFIYNRYNIVCQLDKNGKLLNYFFSPSVAAKETSTSLGVLHRALEGKAKHANQFQWCYYKDLPSKIDNKIFNFGNNLAVAQYKNGNLIQTYKSTKEAGKANNLDSSSISKVCRGERKSCGGYQWEYLTE